MPLCSAELVATIMAAGPSKRQGKPSKGAPMLCDQSNRRLDLV